MRSSCMTALSLAGGIAAVQASSSAPAVRRSIVSTNSSQITIKDIPAPADWNTSAVEDHSQYRFRYMLIGCGEMHNTAFFDACCYPRPAQAQKDSSYPLACSLTAYQIFNPVHTGNQWVATLASATNVTALLDDTEYAAVIPPAGFSTASPKSTSTRQPSTSAKRSATSSTEQIIVLPKQTTPSVLPTHDAPSVQSPSASPNTPSTTPAAAPYTPPVTPSSTPANTPAAALFAPVNPTSNKSPDYTPPASTPATSAAPAPAAAASASSFTGQATYFYQGGNAGACGIYHSDNDDIVALKVDLYGWTGQKSQYCGKSLTITNTDNGKTATAIVADACPGCSSYYSLDLSTGLFAKLGDPSKGVLPISWHWN